MFKKGNKRQREERERQVTHSYPVQEAPGCHCLCHWEYAKAVGWPVTAGKTHPDMEKKSRTEMMEDSINSYSVKIMDGGKQTQKNR